MASSNVFKITLVVSAIAHGIILSQNPNLNFSPFRKKDQVMEVKYIKERKQAKSETRMSAVKKEPFLKMPSKVTLQEKAPPPYVDREKIFRKSAKAAPLARPLDKPAISKPDIIAVKKKITLPPVDMNKINNPNYISYYQIIREKIRRSAYQNYTRTETGNVYLSFIVSRDGYLKEVRLAEDKSSKSRYLRETALSSIKEASPFPVFPKELDYPSLSFNVVISFEIE